MSYSYDIEEIVLDINNGIPYNIPDVRVKSGDRNSRKIVAQITYNEAPYDLSNVSASFYMLKPDGTKVFTSAEIIDVKQGRVSANFTEQMLSVAGNAKGEFLFTRGNDSLLSTPVFKIVIDASINDKNAIESANEFSALVDALDSVHNLDDQIERLDTELRDAIEHLTEIEDDVAIIDETLALAKDFTGANEHRLVQDKDKMDYLGNVHDTIRDARNATVNWMLGEINTLDYEGQHITANNSIEGHVKSAILKGNTLVNLLTKTNIFVSANTSVAENLNIAYILPPKKYIMFYNVVVPNTSPNASNNRHTPRVNLADGSSLYQGYDGFNTSTGRKYWIFTASSNIVDVYYWVQNISTDVVVNNCMLLEYQKGMEHWDIPFFTGMRSVKMPVLKTVGKNLFDINGEVVSASATSHLIKDNSLTVTGKWYVSYLVNLKPSTQYVLSCESIEGDYISMAVYKNNLSEIIATNVSTNNKFVFTTPSEFNDIRVVFYASQSGTTYHGIQLEEGSTVSSFEPHKANILTVNEDVTLRSNGDVYDELNLLTGRLTQRIDENNEVLSQEVVKTVDLSDNVVYSYDSVTHYDCSSEDGSLVPTVSLTVPTDVNAVVSTQRATIQEQTEQINTLEKENTLLTEQNEKQDIEIALNQDAINFMLFEVMGLSNDDDANKLNPMAIYFANQILKGKLTYTQVIGKYPQFKDDIDSCLLAEGRSDLIVKID